MTKTICKRFAVFILAVCVSAAGFGQRNVADSLQSALAHARTDTVRAEILYNLSYAYQLFEPDSALLFAQQSYDISARKHFLRGESWSLNQMGNAFRELGNNALALTYYLQQLKIEEERGFADNLATVDMNIAVVYNREKDTAKAIFYILKADSIISVNHFSELETYSTLNAGDILEKAGRLPEALRYTQRSYDLAIKANSPRMIGSALNNLGNIYSKTGELEKAQESYHAGLPYLLEANDNQTQSESRLGLAKVFLSAQQKDSALLYARQAFAISANDGFLNNQLAASELLTRLYKDRGKLDSAFTYQQLMVNLKDSIGGIERVKEVESMSLAEELRQQHLAAVAVQEKKETREKLELLLIGIFIPIFFLFSMYITRKRVSRRLIQFFGVLSLLMLFEYITLLIHPLVANATNHSPFFEITILVALAALVVPAHHRIEHWFVERLAGMHERRMQIIAVKQVPVAEESPSEPLEEMIDETDSEAKESAT